MIEIRRVWTQVEDVFHEFGPRGARPQRRGELAVVLANPYAGRYEPDIMPMMEALKPLGLDMSRRLVAVLGGDPKRIQGYGKGAIVGAVVDSVWPLITDGTVRPVIGARLPIEQVIEAHRMLAAGEPFGKLILTISD